MSNPKIKKEDILAATGEMLQKQMYVVFTKPINGMGPVMANLEDHLKFQIQLETDGIMYGAGPFWADNEQDWNGEGMVIIRSGSLAEARKIAEGDPMHSSGARSFEVRPWLLNEGTISIKLDYSTGKYSVT
jgi:uncharacterized protein YciI